MNYLVMSEAAWDRLEYTYFQLIKHLHLIILTRDVEFFVYKNQFSTDVRKTYPLTYLKEYLRDHEALGHLTKMEMESTGA